MFRDGFGGGDVAFERAQTVPQAQGKTELRQRYRGRGRGIVFKHPIADVDLDLLNQNAWENYNEILPPPSER